MRVHEMAVEVDGETTLSGLDALLVRRAAWLPIDGEGAMKVADLIAADSAGPLVEGFGGWEACLQRVELVGARGSREVLEGEDVKLVVGSRGELGRVARVSLTAAPRPAGALLLRVREEVSLNAFSPHWRVWQKGSITAGWLGSDESLTELTAGLAQAGGVGGGGLKGAIVMRQALLEDEMLRGRLWRWPEGVAGERVRVHLPGGAIRATMLEARIMAWIADGPGRRVLATLPARDIDRLAEVVASRGGWVERVERALSPAEIQARWGDAAAERFEDLRRRIQR